MSQFPLKINSLAVTYDSPEKTKIYTLKDSLQLSGKKSSGKSTFVRFMMQLLGNPQLEYTPTVVERVHSCSLSFSVDRYLVDIIQNTAQEDSEKRYQVTLFNQKLQESSEPFYLTLKRGDQSKVHRFEGVDMRTLTDLFRFLFKEESFYPFGDIRYLFDFCYLKQEASDSDFFNLKPQYKNALSNEHQALKYILGYDFSPAAKVNKEKNEFKKIKDKLKNEQDSTKNLSEHGFPKDKKACDKMMKDLEEKREKAEKGLREADKSEQHPTDTIRAQLLELSLELVALDELYQNVGQKIRLIERSHKNCPACLQELPKREENHCSLCAQELAIDSEHSLEELKKHHGVIRYQIKDCERKKVNLQRVYDREAQAYLPSKMAVISRKKEKIAEIDRSIKNLEKYTYSLANNQVLKKNALKAAGDQYKDKKKEEDKLLRKPPEALQSLKEELRVLYLDCLIRSQAIKDEITGSGYLDNSFVPYIQINDKKTKLHYHNVGSGGNKVLFKSCFLIALHRLAQKKNLRLPSLLIMDTPTKNLGETLDESTCLAFYQLIHELKDSELAQTQIIIVDNQSPKVLRPCFHLLEQTMSIDSTVEGTGPFVPSAI